MGSIDTSTLKLFSYWRSSASWRVRIALALKGLDYEYVPVHLVKADVTDGAPIDAGGGEQLQPKYLRVNPMAQVPTLAFEEDGNSTLITQSVAIIELLNEEFPEPGLMPQGAVARATVRQAVELINSGIQPIQNLRVLKAVEALGGDKREWGKDAIERGFVALEALLSRTAGTYAVGDSVTLADICLVPQTYNARRFGVDLSAFPTIERVDAACAALPAFEAAHPNAQPDAPADT